MLVIEQVFSIANFLVDTNMDNGLKMKKWDIFQEYYSLFLRIKTQQLLKNVEKESLRSNYEQNLNFN